MKLICPWTEDPVLRKILEALTLKANADKEQIYVTLLALFLLLEAFGHKEDEWMLLVRKAKSYLKEAGVDKPDKVLRKLY